MNEEETISNRDRCGVCGKLRFEHKDFALCPIDDETKMLRKIHKEIQAALEAARKTPEYKQEGWELHGTFVFRDKAPGAGTNPTPS